MHEKRIVSGALLLCLVLSPAALAAPPIIRPAPAMPTAGPRFGGTSTAARISRNSSSDRNIMLNRGVVGIGNVSTNGAAAGTIVTQTEIRNSTIIIQSK